MSQEQYEARLICLNTISYLNSFAGLLDILLKAVFIGSLVWLGASIGLIGHLKFSKAVLYGGVFWVGVTTLVIAFFLLLGARSSSKGSYLGPLMMIGVAYLTYWVSSSFHEVMPPVEVTAMMAAGLIFTEQMTEVHISGTDWEDAFFIRDRTHLLSPYMIGLGIYLAG